jgi:hypothetical protein
MTRNHTLLTTTSFALVLGLQASAARAGQLGVSLPAISSATQTQGGAPNFADTYVTPFISGSSASVLTWKGQFVPGALNGGTCGIPVGIQLKVLHQTTPTTLKVVAAGAVHNPLTALQTRLNTTGCPSFLMNSNDAVLEFEESGLILAPGDIIGLTIKSNPTPPGDPGYFYPLVTAGTTRLVLRDAGANDTIDLADSFTGTLPNSWAPALSVNLGIDVSLDIKPGSSQNTINLSSAGVIPVAVLSTPTFSAKTIDPDTLFLAGAPVGVAGKSGKFLCQTRDVNWDNLDDLVCDFDTAQFLIHTGDTLAELVGKTFSGVAIRGQDIIRIVPD